VFGSIETAVPSTTDAWNSLQIWLKTKCANTKCSQKAAQVCPGMWEILTTPDRAPSPWELSSLRGQTGTHRQPRVEGYPCDVQVAAPYDVPSLRSPCRALLRAQLWNSIHTALMQHVGLLTKVVTTTETHNSSADTREALFSTPLNQQLFDEACKLFSASPPDVSEARAMITRAYQNLTVPTTHNAKLLLGWVAAVNDAITLAARIVEKRVRAAGGAITKAPATATSTPAPKGKAKATSSRSATPAPVAPDGPSGGGGGDAGDGQGSDPNQQRDALRLRQFRRYQPSLPLTHCARTGVLGKTTVPMRSGRVARLAPWTMSSNGQVGLTTLRSTFTGACYKVQTTIALGRGIPRLVRPTMPSGASFLQLHASVRHCRDHWTRWGRTVRPSGYQRRYQRLTNRTLPLRSYVSNHVLQAFLESFRHRARLHRRLTTTVPGARALRP
jgi:hypothetical protein